MAGDQPQLMLYSTLEGAMRPFTPLDPQRVTIYSCGPTVYRYVHIGNLRTFLMADILCRCLEYLGFQAYQVMNITDVGHLTDEMFDRGEDKMLVAAEQESKTPQEIAAYYTQAFTEDCALVNIRPAALYPKASDHVERMQLMIAGLVELGHAYEVEGTVYFDVTSFAGYGKLSRNSLDQMQAGHRSQVDPKKRNPQDFVLWQRAGSRRLIHWPSPWGQGYPGWHIECSAMSTAYLGEQFDIHTGGADNVFPHHEDEIAQSEAYFGHRVVNYWIHGQHLFLGRARMAKSAGNFFRITDVSDQGIDPLAFRLLALQTRYRTKMHFSQQALQAAWQSLNGLRQHYAEFAAAALEAGTEGSVDLERQMGGRFVQALCNDLNLAQAAAVVSQVVRSQDLDPRQKLHLMSDFDRVLGLDLDRLARRPRQLPAGASELLAMRERARTARNWAEADSLRQRLRQIGVEVTDTPQGTRWAVLAD